MERSYQLFQRSTEDFFFLLEGHPQMRISLLDERTPEDPLARLSKSRRRSANSERPCQDAVSFIGSYNKSPERRQKCDSSPADPSLGVSHLKDRKTSLARSAEEGAPTRP